MDVRGKTVVVAGGAGSLGSVLVASLNERGARVASLDMRYSREFAPEVMAIQTDIADDAAVAAALRAIAADRGPIAALVNCAGLIHSEPLVSLTDPSQRRHRLATWEATIRANLTATFVLGAHVAELMASTRTKGVIISFSSIAAHGNPGQTAYAAAKAGIEAMTTVWARELGPLGIRAVAIAPGFVATDSTRSAMSESSLSDLKRRTPLLRLAKPEEIASAVAFAIENDFVTGTTIAVDGGLVL
jgi:3-oxoacyl-[acyl-carrier protein] reductase